MANYTARDLVEMGTLPSKAVEACAECLRKRRNILVTGITGSGKTTTILALAGLLPADESLFLLDDCDDLYLDGPSRHRILLRPDDHTEPFSKVFARALRSAQGRLVIGNVCPPEAGAVLRALSSDRYQGSLLATCAASAHAALRQLATWSLLDGFSWKTAGAGIAAAIHLVLHVERQAD